MDPDAQEFLEAALAWIQRDREAEVERLLAWWALHHLRTAMNPEDEAFLRRHANRALDAIDGLVPRHRRGARQVSYYRFEPGMGRPLPPPHWPARHPLAADPPIEWENASSGAAAAYESRVKLRGWIGRRERSGDGLPRCERCGLAFNPIHQRPDDRHRGECFRCLAIERSLRDQPAPDLIPAGAASGPGGVWRWGVDGAVQRTTRWMLKPLAQEVMQARPVELHTCV